MASQSNQQFFPGAINPTIHGGIFAAVQGDMHIHSPDSRRHGLELLIANIAQGAFHDAAERGTPPRCHPGTRTAILEAIMEWARAPDAHRKFILWLYGPAGAGKSAIAQTIAEECEKAGLLAASFFFGRTAAGRNNSSRVVATLAYQLSRSIPEICEPILATIEKDPTIFSRSISVQMRALVTVPLASLTGPIRKDPQVMVMDGVDECGPNGQAQVELLDVIRAAVSELRHIPIIFLVSSRPEYDIRLAFNMNPLSSLMKGLVLDDDYQADADIELYLNSKFQEVREKQFTLGTPLSSRWPTEDDIDRLVKKSSGQFIFASTAVKFIESGRDPAKCLHIILGLSDPGKETPFALLDALYQHILSSVDDLPKVLDVLTLIMLEGGYTVDVVDDLLGFEVRRALADMHALVFVPPPTDPGALLRIHHASLYDFLMDRSRSLDFFVDAKQGHIMIGQRWFGMIANYSHSKRSKKCPLSTQIEAVERHCGKLPGGELVDCLASFDLGALLKKIRDPEDLYGVEWDKFMTMCKLEQAKKRRADIFRRLQNQFHGFILDRVSQYPSSIQACIPFLFVMPEHLFYEGMVQQLFLILLHGACRSEAEFTQIQELDGSLLNIWNFRNKPYFRSFFEGRLKYARYARQRSAVALVKQIVTIIYAKSGAVSHYILAENIEVLLPNEPPIVNDILQSAFNLAHDNFVPGLIATIPPNVDLACFLRAHVLPYRYNKCTESSNSIALASLKYVQKCDIPYLEHTHPPNIDSCIICERCPDAFVREDTADISPTLKPIPNNETSPHLSPGEDVSRNINDSLPPSRSPEPTSPTSSTTALIPTKPVHMQSTPSTRQSKPIWAWLCNCLSSEGLDS